VLLLYLFKDLIHDEGIPSLKIEELSENTGLKPHTTDMSYTNGV
jgi:hypothetical protein